MTDQKKAQKSAETFVKEVLTSTFKQNVDAEMVRDVARKVAKAIPA